MANDYTSLYNSFYKAQEAFNSLSLANKPVVYDEYNTNAAMAVEVNLNDINGQIFKITNSLALGEYYFVLRARREIKTEDMNGAFIITIVSDNNETTHKILKSDFKEEYKDIVVPFSFNDSNDHIINIYITKDSSSPITEEDIYYFDEFKIFPDIVALSLQNIDLSVNVIQKRTD